MQLVVGGWPLQAERHKKEQATGNSLGLRDHRKERILLQSSAAGEQLPASWGESQESPNGEKNKEFMEFGKL